MRAGRLRDKPGYRRQLAMDSFPLRPTFTLKMRRSWIV